MTASSSPYEVLGIAEGASPDEIRRAYRRQALRYHPDRNPGDPTAKESFLRVQEAFQQIDPTDPDAGFDAARVVAEMQRAAEEVERRRGRAASGGRTWQQVRVPLDRPRADEFRSQLRSPQAVRGLLIGLGVAVIGVAAPMLLSGLMPVPAWPVVGLGLLAGSLVASQQVLTASPEPWAVETHWRGLRDQRWDVMVAWDEIRGVRQTDGAVDLALTAPGAQRVARLVPADVFIAPAIYRLPVRDGSRLVPAVRAQLEGGVRLGR